MHASVGRIVHYQLTSENAEKINKWRHDALAASTAEDEDGSQLHYGNDVYEGEIFPMIVTRVLRENLVNGKVMLDGSDTFWATSVEKAPQDEAGETQHQVGSWFWPALV